VILAVFYSYELIWYLKFVIYSSLFCTKFQKIVFLGSLETI